MNTLIPATVRSCKRKKVQNYKDRRIPKTLNVYEYEVRVDKNGDKSEFDKWKNDCTRS